VGTPFFLFTSQPSSALLLFSDAYQSGTPITGPSSAVTASTATVAGSVDPNGTAVNVTFQFGTTTAYGQLTPVQRLGPDDAADTSVPCSRVCLQGRRSTIGPSRRATSAL
jgi:hypothetical protein